MCGIAGKFVLAADGRVSEPEIQRMLVPMAHRGPDGHGIHLDGPVGLGHLRLAIIDVDGGPQPMSNEDGTVWIVFNGEIYNFQSLRERLIGRGHTFKSHCDTEVIVHAYEEYGFDCVKHLRGMFAFAIWDKVNRRLFAARDRVGIKPFYYCQTAHALSFASELKGIVADPAIPRDFNLLALRQFLSFYYLPGEQTLFQHVKKLLPGHFLVAEKGQVRVSRYWDLEFNRNRAHRSFDEVVEELHSLLESTVRDHMIADVPVGVLLSGGVDSSAVLNFAVNGTTKKIKTFTVGFDGNDVIDERPYARLAAERFGTEHHELTITAEDFWDFLPRYVWHMEEPVCEPPAVALYYVSKLARDHVKVLLSGEGGDEAFGGYPNYPNMMKLHQIRQALGPLARLGGMLASALGNFSNSPRIRKYGAALGLPLAEHYFSRTSSPTTYFNRNANKIFSPEFLSATHASSPAATMAAVLESVAERPLLDQMLYADTMMWLPDDLLVKADKITMANSLELRVPLLDHEVLEFAASLPDEYKVKGNETKRALKAAFAKVLPSEVIHRKKAGFPVPYIAWLRGPLSRHIEEIVTCNRALNRNHFDSRAIRQLLKDNENTGRYSKEVFALLVTELWHKQFADTSEVAAERLDAYVSIQGIPS